MYGDSRADAPFWEAAPHTVITMGQGNFGVPRTPEELMTPPEHVIDLLLGMMRPYPEQPAGPPRGSIDYARAARAEARTYAQRVWVEAAHAGFAYALATEHTRVQVIEVTPEKMAELRRCASANVQPGTVVPAAAEAQAAAAAAAGAAAGDQPTTAEEST